VLRGEAPWKKPSSGLLKVTNASLKQVYLSVAVVIMDRFFHKWRMAAKYDRYNKKPGGTLWDTIQRR